MVLYRATSAGYVGVGSHWSSSREDAEAYTAPGVGHGGERVLAMRPSPDDVILRVRDSRELASEILAAMNADEAAQLDDELEGGPLAEALRGMYVFQVLEGEAGTRRRSVLADVPAILARVADWIVFYEPRVGDAMLVCETWRRLDDRHPMIEAF